MSDILHRLPEFIGNHLVLVTLFLLVLASLIGNEISRFFRGYRELTPAALTQLINRESPLVVDLSAPGDFEKAHIPGARNVQLSQFDPENKDLAPVKDRWSRPASSRCSGSAAAWPHGARPICRSPRDADRSLRGCARAACMG
jgi:hypothetical protein